MASKSYFTGRQTPKETGLREAHRPDLAGKTSGRPAMKDMPRASIVPPRAEQDKQLRRFM